MPNISSKLQLTSGAISANTALADIQRIKGAFKVYTSTVLNSTSVNYFSDGQIVYVSDSGSLYKANVTLADYEYTFNDTVAFSEFSFNSGSFMSGSFDGVKTLTLFGQNLQGSDQISMSIDLSALTGSGGGGGGGATWIGDLLDISTASLDDGDVLAWNASANSWQPTNVSGTGDISAVFAGDGLSGGGTQGSVSLDVNAGDGIVLTASGVNVSTGSAHFVGGVQKIEIDGETF
jgi:hypothetical protein